MNYKERIKKIKRVRGDDSEAEIKIPLDPIVEDVKKTFKRVFEKITTIETGSTADQTSKEIVELLEKEGIKIKSFQNFVAGDFSLRGHNHREFEKFITKDDADKIKFEIGEQAQKIVKNIEKEMQRLSKKYSGR